MIDCYKCKPIEVAICILTNISEIICRLKKLRMDLIVNQSWWSNNVSASESMAWGLGLRELERIFKVRNDEFKLLSAICKCKGSLPALEDVYFDRNICMFCQKALPHICKFCQISQGIVICLIETSTFYICKECDVSVCNEVSCTKKMSSIYQLRPENDCFRYLLC
jgi:hypothetical protein